MGLRNVNFFQNIFFLKENEDSGGTFENISIVEMWPSKLINYSSNHKLNHWFHSLLFFQKSISTWDPILINWHHNKQVVCGFVKP